jgi:hypothetical protein
MSSRRERIVEFRGKYDVVTPDELRHRSDEELVKLILERGEMDEARALKELAHLRRSWLGRVVYHRA